MTPFIRTMFLVAAGVVLASPAGAESLRPVTMTGHCVGVESADALEVWFGVHDQVVPVLLAGLDGSSIQATFPRVAEQLVRNLAEDRPVSVEVYDRRRDGVVVGRVLVKGIDLGYELVAEGLARAHARAPASLHLDLAETEARDLGLGMWYDPTAEALEESGAGAVEPGLSDIAWQLDYRRDLRPGEWVGPPAEDAPRLSSWVGLHRSAVVANLGPPSWIEVGDDGSEVLVYDLCRGRVVAATDICTLRYEMGGDGFVTARHWQ